MEVSLRDPKTLMKLSKLGSFHQSKLSFLRSFLNEFKDWEYRRAVSYTHLTLPTNACV